MAEQGYEQIQYMHPDLNTELKVDQWQEFMYDPEDNVSLNAIKDVIEKAGNLRTSTNSLENALGALTNGGGPYANKTAVKSSINLYLNGLKNYNDRIDKSIEEWCEGVKAFYESQVESDQSLLDDLQVINDYLDDGSLSDWNR